MTFNSYKRAKGVENRYLFSGKERMTALGTNFDDFGARMYMPDLGRWTTVDPLAEQMESWSPYNYTFNNPIKFTDPDGRAPAWPPWLGPALMFSRTPPAMARPVSVPRVTPRPVTPRLAPRSTPRSATVPKPKPKKLPQEVIENFRRGNKSEAEQLSKRKNTKPFDVTDSQTGQTTRTIPDSFGKNGKQTIEIKDVKNQSLTKQLRAQRQISNENGVQPKLIIRKGVNLSKPLQEGGFDIEFFNVPPLVPADATHILRLDPTLILEKFQIEREKSNPCYNNPNCI